ncbi:DUF2637 domain-containing protein [Streptomyces sp. NBC_01221]|uniref:DUF2637 domain-containing protein n=1 Tax=Streptomyces sp. NBC_01221 TaxID=2903782 RepID=UPI0022558D91|nr:DUF2637 domain-containing protein [Streptomyces sp. NBC_01221]MCX4787670.1 DUF2637 domain-containing protein [Streptomyces sp. NBC_01221]
MNVLEPHFATPPPLIRSERILLGTVALAGVGVGGLGLASSFNSVSAAAERWGFTEPWMLPIGIDFAIPVFTAANLLLIRLGMPMAWVRVVPWALTLVTCWLNVAAGASTSARIAHGTMPLLWVVLSEVVAHGYAVKIGAVTGRRMERIRRSRWIFAPRATFALWRRMVLWELTDYREALRVEKQRLLARAELRERFGHLWRWRAPRRDLVLLRMGELGSEADPSADEGGDDEETGPETPKPRTRRRTGRDKNAPRLSWDDALAKARDVTADWSYEHLDAERIRKAVGCSQDRSRQLRDVLKADREAQMLPDPAGV